MADKCKKTQRQGRSVNPKHSGRHLTPEQVQANVVRSVSRKAAEISEVGRNSRSTSVHEAFRAVFAKHNMAMPLSSGGVFHAVNSLSDEG